ncbi:hypothetical protein [Thalassococcus profundi]|uniref:hypothetical protein n=1 Tax=Thalassococcus profundi TaxID=2282382 RepID=UPI001F3FB127|nr:hypothetical protein [Thalassococcus profundi]
MKDDDARLLDWSTGNYKQSHRTDRCSTTPSHDSLAAKLIRFHHDAGLPGDDVLHQVVHVRLGDVADAPGAEEGGDVAADTAHIDLDRRRLLGATAFTHDQAGLHILDVLLADLLDRQRLAVFVALFGRVVSPGDVPE